jgi:hypothetical protein
VDKRKKIIDNSIEKYQSFMGEDNYNGFIQGMAQTKGGAWLAKQILQDVIAYLIARNDIEIQIDQFHKEEERAALS